MLRYIFTLVLVLILNLCSFRQGLAAPIYPRLEPATLNQVHSQLKKSISDQKKISLWLQLSKHHLNNAINKGINEVRDLDSAYFYARNVEKISTTLSFNQAYTQSQYIIGIINFHTGKKEKAHEIIHKALELSRELGDKTLEAEGWYFLGECQDFSITHIPEKLKCYEQAKKLYRQMNNVEQEAYLLEAIANLHYHQGNPTLANKELLQVISMYRSISYPKLHYTYNLLASANKATGNYKEAIQFGLATIESAKATHDTVEFGEYHYNLGRIYEDLKQWDRMLFYYKKALTYFTIEKNVYFIHSMAGKISSYLLNNSKPKEALAFYLKITKEYPSSTDDTNEVKHKILADCYLALKKYKLAEKHYEQMLLLEDKQPLEHGYPLNRIQTYKKIGHFYLITNQFSKARNILNKAMRLNTETGTVLFAGELHLLLFKLDSTQGKLNDAIKHYQQYKLLNDSIFNENKSKQIANLQILYQTKEKEQRINLLNKQNQVQRANIAKKEFQRNALIVGTGLLLLLSGVVYNRYRLKQQSNKLLQAKQEEIHRKNKVLELVLQEKEGLLEQKEWMMKEIHHRVKNNLQVISGLLYSQSTFLDDSVALTAIQASQNRVHAMAIIHQKLYKSDNPSLVTMSAYIQEITHYLLVSYNREDSITLEMDIAEVVLDMAIAVPLGLIINEVLTNCLKYAFPSGQLGTINIQLNYLESNVCNLSISDNGVGFPSNFDYSQNSSLGISIIRGLSRQIGGNLQLSQHNGVTVQLEFSTVKHDKSPYLYA